MHILALRESHQSALYEYRRTTGSVEVRFTLTQRSYTMSDVAITKGAHHIGLTVPDVTKTRAFFVDSLGFEQVGEVPDYPHFSSATAPP